MVKVAFRGYMQGSEATASIGGVQHELPVRYEVAHLMIADFGWLRYYYLQVRYLIVVNSVPKRS
jgi:hypothetical protein